MSEARGDRWAPVVAYTLVSAANQMLWLTYAPITTGSAHRYGVSSGAIGWLAELFPLLYVVLALPTGRLIDRDLPRWLAVGAAATAAGAVLRLGDTYAFALLGQVLIALAQPLVLNAVLPVTVRYLTPARRSAGLALASAGIFAGMVLALALGTAFGSSGLTALLVVQAALALAATVALGVTLRRAPGAPPTRSRAVPLREVWADRPVRLLVGLVCAGFGVFVALTTWLQTLLHPAGVSDDAAGVLLLVLVVAGVLGAALLPAPLAARGRQLHFVLASVLGGVAALLVLAFAPGVPSGAVVLVVLGVFLLTDLPLILDLVERRAPQAGGTAGGLMWLAGNAAGLVAALVVQAEVHHPALAFCTLAVLLAVGAPLTLALRRRLDRSDLQVTA